MASDTPPYMTIASRTSRIGSSLGPGRKAAVPSVMAAKLSRERHGSVTRRRGPAPGGSKGSWRGDALSSGGPCGCREGVGARGARGRLPPTRPPPVVGRPGLRGRSGGGRSEEHTSELQSRGHLVCRLLLEKKKDLIL